LMEQIGGAALSSPGPRGLQGAATAGVGLNLAADVAQGASHPSILGLLLASSPRVMGEATFRGGQVAGAATRLGKSRLGRALVGNTGSRLAANEIGRLEKELREQGYF